LEYIVSTTEQSIALPDPAPAKPDSPIAPPEVTKDPLDKKWRDLKWGVERSIRYHMRREGYFGVLHRITGFVGVLSSTAAVTSFLKEWDSFGIAFGLLVALISGLDLVLGFAKMERTHYELRRRFYDLLGTMQTVVTAEAFVNATRERFNIEKDEPPVFRALDIACHNELMRAQGKLKSDPKYTAHYYDIDWFQRLTKHLSKWESMA
jgi:hypothetical protein